MAVPFWTLEPEGTPVVLTDPYRVTAQQLPMPPLAAQYSSSSDSDGDTPYSKRYGNRVITLSLIVVGTSAADLESKVHALQLIVAKQNRNGSTSVGGTIKYTSPSGAVATFDVCTASIDGDLDLVYAVRDFARFTLEFGCLPFWRGVEAEV